MDRTTRFVLHKTIATICVGYDYLLLMHTLPKLVFLAIICRPSPAQNRMSHRNYAHSRTTPPTPSPTSRGCGWVPTTVIDIFIIYDALGK